MSSIVQRTHGRRSLLNATRISLAVAAALVFVAPIAWMVLTALKTRAQAFSTGSEFFFTPTLENFRSVFTESAYGYSLITSIQTAGFSTIAALILGAGIAYPMARYPFRGQQHLALWILSLRIIPPIVTIIPLFLLIRALGLTGDLSALIVVYTFMNLPITVWLLRGFFADVPKETEEAAMVDGLGGLRIFWKITLPLSLPGVVATGLLAFVFAWNEFLFANILTGAGTRTATVGLTEFVTPVSIEWTRIMAAGTIVVLPVWVAALLAQRYLVRGLTLGAVK